MLWYSCLLDIVALTSAVFAIQLLFMIFRINIVIEHREIVEEALTSYFLSPQLKARKAPTGSVLAPSAYIEPFACSFMRFYDWSYKRILIDQDLYDDLYPYIRKAIKRRREQKHG